MATYIQGLSDYIPQIQPFRPDYNFYAGVLQTKQAQYEAGYKQLSSIYGDILSSPMLRDVNNQRREQYLSAAENQIKRIAGVDLSLPENVDAAYEVFKPFYSDKNMMKDMAWTRQYQKELERADNYRNCFDAKKCNGKYWDVGVAALNYKANEFRNSTDEQAQNFSNPRFTPYIDVTAKAIELAKESGINLKKDYITGQWIVTKKNGEQIIGPLYALFADSLGSDPDIQSMFNTQAYVERKSFVEDNKITMGSEQAAESAYISKVFKDTLLTQTKNAREASGRTDEVLSERARLQRKSREEGLTAKEQTKLLSIDEDLGKLGKTNEYYDTITSMLTAPTDNESLNSLRHRADSARASMLMNNSLMRAAITLSHRDEEETVKENPYGLAGYKFSLDLQMEAVKHTHAKEMAGLRATLDLEKSKALKNIDFKFKLLEKKIEEEGLESIAGFLDPSMRGIIGTGGQGQMTVKEKGAGWWNVDVAEQTGDVKQVFKEGEQTQKRLTDTAKGKLINFISDFYRLSSNALDKPNATRMLEESFGEGWRDYDLRNLNSLPMSKLTSMYNTMLGYAQIKKCPNCDRMWSQTYLDQHKKDMQDIDIARQAAYAVQEHRRKINKDVSRRMIGDKTEAVLEPEKTAPNVLKGQISKINLYSDAELYVTPRGDKMPEGEFIKAYVAKHKNDDVYREAEVIKQGKHPTLRVYGWDTSKYARDIVKDAKKIYEALDNKFFDLYNDKSTTDVDLEGIGAIHGWGGGKTSNPMVVKDLDPLHYRNPYLQAVRSVIEDVSDNVDKDRWTVVMGDPAKENVEDAAYSRARSSTEMEKEQILKNFVTAFNNDISTRYKKGDKKVRPQFTATYSNIAANDMGKSALTIDISNPEYFDRYIGTEKKPGILFKIKDDLAQSGYRVSMVFPEADANNTFKNYNKRDALDYIINFNPEGLKYDQYKDVAGEVTITSDGIDYKASGKVISYDNGRRVSTPYTETWPVTTDITVIDHTIKTYLEDLKKANEYVEFHLDNTGNPLQQSQDK